MTGDIALFVPCFIDQLYPHVGIAALRVLERLGLRVDVPDGAACCGQPPANAGFERDARRVLSRFAETYKNYQRTVVLSASCAMHIKSHAATHVADRTTEFCAFLHDDVGLAAVNALGVSYPRQVALHIGCHGLRGLGLARPSEIQSSSENKVQALLETVRGLTFAKPARTDECCGFGGTFAVGEPAISAKMGRDRIRDYRSGGAEAVVSTDVSCLMHLSGLAGRDGLRLPALHVAEVLAGAGI
jgi:L-lactate dehydrogenase complex protein LldE